MFFGNPETYKFAPFIDSLEGRAKETFKEDKDTLKHKLKHKLKDPQTKISYFNSFVLKSQSIEGIDCFISIFLALIIDKSITQTLTYDDGTKRKRNNKLHFHFNKLLSFNNQTKILPVTLSLMSLQDSTSPMLENNERISSCVIVCGK